MSANGAFLDIAVLEWCKLFGDKKSKSHYSKVIVDPGLFMTELLAHLGITNAELDAYIAEVRTYRDKFIAHLDDQDVMNIPSLDIAKDSTTFLYARLLAQAAGTETFLDAPTSATAFYDQWHAAGRAEYAG